MTTAIVPWCVSCGCEGHGPYDGPIEVHPPICATPGCFKVIDATHGRQRCDVHRRERALERRRLANARWRGGVAQSPVTPFAFDAIRAWMPAHLRTMKKGRTESGWWGHLSERLLAMRPELTPRNARQIVGRLRGTFLDPYEADEWAIALGVHPSEIWANWWSAVEIEGDAAA